jgi:hypothetical protein
MDTTASSGRTKRLFHRKSIATIDAIEHALNVANSYLAYWQCITTVVKLITGRRRYGGGVLKRRRNKFAAKRVNSNIFLKIQFKSQASIALNYTCTPLKVTSKMM